MSEPNNSGEDLKTWLSVRLSEIDSRISSLEASLGGNEGKQSLPPIGRIRPAWLKTLSVLRGKFRGIATAEQLSETMQVNKSVVSGYMARLVSMGLVKRKYNNTKAPGRYIFALTDAGEQLLSLTKKRG